MIPHIHTLFEFISIPYENQHQTLNIKKIDRGQIRFRDYWITLLQPKEKVRVTDNFFFFAYWFLKIFRMRRYMTQCTFIDNSRFTTFLKSLRVLKFWHKMAYFDPCLFKEPVFPPNAKFKACLLSWGYGMTQPLSFSWFMWMIRGWPVSCLTFWSKFVPRTRGGGL